MVGSRYSSSSPPGTVAGTENPRGGGGVKRHSVRYTAYVPDSANQFRTSLGQISRNQGAAVGKLWLPGKSPLTATVCPGIARGGLEEQHPAVERDRLKF